MLPRWFSRPFAAGAKRGALDQEMSTGLVQGTSAEPVRSVTECCLICDKPIREGEATVGIDIVRTASDRRPGRGPAHSHCFRAEILGLNW